MTKPINVLIVEDEPIIADDIALSLEEVGYIIDGIEASAEGALKHLSRSLPDIILLDIKIKGNEDGIRLGHKINQLYQIPFLFISSLYDQNTISRAKAASPAGYIVKPFKETDLKVNIELALSKSKSPASVETSELNLFVKQAGAMVPLNFKLVTYVEADDNYSVFHTESEKHLVSHTLKEIEDKLHGQGFCRVHKTYIVNLRKIDRIEQSVLFIEDQMIPIGKVYRKSFFDRLTVF